MGTRLIAIAATALLGGASDGPRPYAIDRQASAVSARVAFLLLASKTAEFPDISGTAEVLPGHPESLDLDVRIDARTLKAPDDVTLQRLRGDKFFWVARYPTIRFEGRGLVLTGPREGRISGRLTARGVTRPVTLTVRFDRSPDRVAAGEPLELTADARIDRRDFGMTAYPLIVARAVDIRITARLVPA